MDITPCSMKHLCLRFELFPRDGGACSLLAIFSTPYTSFFTNPEQQSSNQKCTGNSYHDQYVPHKAHVVLFGIVQIMSWLVCFVRINGFRRACLLEPAVSRATQNLTKVVAFKPCRTADEVIAAPNPKREPCVVICYHLYELVTLHSDCHMMQLNAHP